MKELRLQEVKVLIYRIFLVFVFYQAARFLFWFFNRDLLEIDSVSQYFKLAYYGTAFDTTAILYVNIVFIFFSLIPLTINTKGGYQKFLFWLYFILNGIAYAMNFGDIVYYRFSQSRLTSAVINVVENEQNIGKVFLVSLGQNFWVFLCFVVLMGLWIFLYKRLKVKEIKIEKKILYFGGSVVSLCLAAVLIVGGIRGDFKHSTRPINLVDANRHTDKPAHANIVLNSTFSFFRTINTNGFKEVHFVDEKYIAENVKPYKTYQREVPQPRPNIVILIVEILGR